MTDSGIKIVVDDVGEAKQHSPPISPTVGIGKNQKPSRKETSVTTDVMPDVTAEGDCRIHHTLHIQQEALCCHYSQDGRLFAMGLLNGTLRIYDPPVINCMYILADAEVLQRNLPATCVRFQPSLKQGAKRTHFLAAAYASGFVKVWNVELKQVMCTFQEERQTLTLAFSRDGYRLVVGGSDAKLNVYDISRQVCIKVLEASEEAQTKMDGHKLRIFACLYHPSQDHVVFSGGWDNVVHIWDDREPHAVRSIYGPHICGDGIDVHPEEPLVLTASWNKRHSLQLWDINSCELIKDIVPDNMFSLLYCAQFLKKHFIIAGGSNANLVRLIDRSTFTTVGTLKNLPNAVFCMTQNAYFVNPKIVAIAGEYIYVIEARLRQQLNLATDILLKSQ